MASSSAFRAEALVLGESAIIDKETGRIFWESGGSSSTLSESIIPKLTMGLKHTRATILTGLLLLAAAGAVTGSLRQFLQTRFGVSDTLRPFYQAALLSFAQKILLLPKLPCWFVVAVFFLYLAEAYFCSTRQYLVNAMDSTEAVGTYIKRLRDSDPIVEWKVRSFHYEPPVQHFSPSSSAENQSNRFLRRRRRKRVTHTAVGQYQYNSCQDQTIAAVWKRNSSATAVVPFTKIVLTMMLVLRDAKARRDYFQQQSDFVRANAHGMADEFSTSIQVPGFRPRILAVRKRDNKVAATLFRPFFFWLFTLAGLTVPYRHWFAAHCDEVRVTVVKETGTDVPPSVKASSSWFKSKASSSSAASETLNFMQNLLKNNEQTAALVEEGLEAASILAATLPEQEANGKESKDEHQPASST